MGVRNICLHYRILRETFNIKEMRCINLMGLIKVISLHLYFEQSKSAAL